MEKVAHKRQEERQKRTFTDAGITIMTVNGQQQFTKNAAQDMKALMN